MVFVMVFRGDAEHIWKSFQLQYTDCYTHTHTHMIISLQWHYGNVIYEISPFSDVKKHNFTCELNIFKCAWLLSTCEVDVLTSD